MRSRRSVNEEVAEVARRRLELLSAELAEIRPLPVGSPARGDRGGSGEPSGLAGEVRPDVVGPSPGPPPSTGAGRHAYRPVGLGASVAGWTQDRLPPILRGRVALSGAHLAVVALVVLFAVAVTLWWVSRADDGETLPPVAAASPIVPSASEALSGDPSASSSPGVAAAAGSPSASPSAAGSVVVDVAGKVRRPGIATLPLGSRVVDALEAAGGPRPGARTGSLNLARVLADGEQIVVGVPVAPGVSASAASAPTAGSGSSPSMVNINSATQAELEGLPGVGPVTALAILDFRSQNGAFTSVDELLEVSGIGEATLAEIAPHVTL